MRAKGKSMTSAIVRSRVRSMVRTCTKAKIDPRTESDDEPPGRTPP